MSVVPSRLGSIGARHAGDSRLLAGNVIAAVDESDLIDSEALFEVQHELEDEVSVNRGRKTGQLALSDVRERLRFERSVPVHSQERREHQSQWPTRSGAF